MTSHQHRYFSRKTHARRVNQLAQAVDNHENRNELIQLISQQVLDDTSKVTSQVFFR